MKVMRLVFAVLLFACLCRPAVALHSNCSEWESVEFWQSVSKDTIEDCVASGFDVNARNEAGETTLMIAAKYGTAETVGALLEAGANANARDVNGSTALMFAAMYGTAEMVKLLLDAGADVSARDLFALF